MSIPLIAALLLPLVYSLLAALLPGRLLRPLAVALLAAELATCASLCRLVHSGGTPGIGGLLFVDALGSFVALLAALVAFACGLYACDSPRPRAFHVLYGLLLSALMLAAFSYNLVLLWLGVEAAVLAAAPLVGPLGGRTSGQPGFRFLLACGMGAALALLGIGLLYTASSPLLGASSQALHLGALAQVASRLDPGALRWACALLLVGYGALAGLAPWHLWKPEAIGAAPAPVGALLAGGLVLAPLLGLARTYGLLAHSGAAALGSQLFALLGLLSVAVPLPFIAWQRDLARLIAYASSQHAGLFLVGLGFGGAWGTYGALQHLLNQALLLPLMLIAAGELKRRGASARAPALKAMLLVGGFGLAGIPPLAPFASELAIALAGFQAGMPWLTLALLALLGTTALVLLWRLWGTPVAEGSQPTERTGPWVLAAAAPLLAGVLLLGALMPPFYRDFLAQAAANIF